MQRLPTLASYAASSIAIALAFGLSLQGCWENWDGLGDDDTSVGDDDTSVDDDDTSVDDDDDSVDDDDDSASSDDDDTTSDDDDATDSPNPTDDGDGVADDLIYAIQDGTIAEGSRVDVQNVVVTGVHNYGVFVQEPMSGRDSGIWVYTGSEAGTFAVGQMVNIIGWTEEYAGSNDDWADSVTEINVGAHLPGAGDDDDSAPGSGETSSITLSSATAATVSGEAVDVAVFSTPDIERYEGVLVTVQNVTVTSAADNYGEWIVTGDVRIDDKLFIYNEPNGVTIGDSFASITGVLDYSYGTFKIEPRDAGDFATQ